MNKILKLTLALSLLMVVPKFLFAVSYNDKNVEANINIGESVQICPLTELGISTSYYGGYDGYSFQLGNEDDVLMDYTDKTLKNKVPFGQSTTHTYHEYSFKFLKKGTYVIRFYASYYQSSSSSMCTYVYLNYTINVAELTSIHIPSSATIKVDDSITLSPIIVDSWATTPMTWNSSNPSVATVDQTGKIQGLKAGNTTISVIAANGVSATCDVTVEPIYITKIELEQSEYKMRKWDTFQLNPNIYPANSSDKKLSWTSTDENIAIVDDDGTITAVGSGTCIVRAKANDGSGKTANCKITVQKSSQSITLTELPSMTYGDSDYPLPMTTEEGNNLVWTSNNSKVAVINENILTIRGAGTATIVASQSGNDDYATFSKSYILSVGKSTLTITADNMKRVVGEENPEFTVYYEGFVNDDTVDKLTKKPIVATTATPESAAGEYPISVSGAVSSNYEITYQPGVLTVTKGTQGIELTELPVMIYGDGDFTLPISTTEGLPLDWMVDNPNVATIQGNILKIVGAGMAKVTATQSGDTNNVAFSKLFSLNVMKASLTIYAENKTRTVGEDNPQFTVKYSGFVNNETEDNLTSKVLVTTTAKKDSHAGEYPILVSGAISANYDIQYETGILTVVKREQTIEISELPVMTYGDKDFTLPSSTIEGMPLTWMSENQDVATIQGNNLKIVGAGKTQVTVSQVGDAYYQGFSKSFSLNVMPATLVAIAEHKSKTVGEQNPDLTISYDGFVNNENEAILLSLPQISCDADIDSPEGEYAIRLTGGHSNNYCLKLVNAILTVSNPSDFIHGDVNSDEKIDISDIVAIINIIAGVAQ